MLAKKTSLVAIITLVCALPAAAVNLRPPRTVLASEPYVWVRALPGQISAVQFPAPITSTKYAVPPDVAVLSVAPNDPRQLFIEAVKPEKEHAFAVSTAAHTYVVVLRRAKHQADSLVKLELPPPPPPAGHEPEPEEDVIQAFWLSQWWGRTLAPGIQIEAVDGAHSETERQRIEYVAHQKGRGYYGWTLRVHNLTDSEQELDVEGFWDETGQLFSVIPQRLGQRQASTLLGPRETMLLHLTYREGRR